MTDNTDFTVQSIDRSKVLFLLDPGHGIDTPGKRSPGKKTVDDGRPGIMEWEFNRDIVKRIINIATLMGIQCVDLVVQKESIPLAERVRRANHINETHRCAFISVHSNAAGKGGWSEARGFRVFQPPNASLATRFLASAIRGAMQRNVDEWKTRQAIKEAGFYVIKKTTMPAVLTENGFMTNRDDCEILESDIGRNAIARAHVAAMQEYIEWLDEK